MLAEGDDGESIRHNEISCVEMCVRNEASMLILAVLVHVDFMGILCGMPTTSPAMILYDFYH